MAKRPLRQKPILERVFFSIKSWDPENLRIAIDVTARRLPGSEGIGIGDHEHAGEVLIDVGFFTPFADRTKLVQFRSHIDLREISLQYPAIAVDWTETVYKGRQYWFRRARQRISNGS